MKKLILFDIDGTLLLTGGAGKLAFDRVFQELYQIEEAWREVYPDGRTDFSLIEELFQKNFQRKPRKQELTLVTERYHAAMEQALREAPNFRLMPGAPELVQHIHGKEHCFLGLATGNFETTAYQKLERAGLRDYFNFGGFGSDHMDRYELTKIAMERGLKKIGRNIHVEEIFLVGDTVHDIRCGQRLGMTTIAVATGSTPVGVLEALRPDFVFEDLRDLENISVIFE